jgi:hypothetical protein
MPRKLVTTPPLSRRIVPLTSAHLSPLPPDAVGPFACHVSSQHPPHTDGEGGRENMWQCTLVGMSALFAFRKRKPLEAATVSFGMHLALGDAFNCLLETA